MSVTGLRMCRAFGQNLGIHGNKTIVFTGGAYGWTSLKAIKSGGVQVAIMKNLPLFVTNEVQQQVLDNCESVERFNLNLLASN